MKIFLCSTGASGKMMINAWRIDLLLILHLTDLWVVSQKSMNPCSLGNHTMSEEHSKCIFGIPLFPVSDQIHMHGKKIRKVERLGYAKNLLMGIRLITYLAP